MSAATMICSPQMVLTRGGVASTSSRVAAARHAPSCMMFRPPRRFNTVPTQGFRAQGCRPRPSTGQQCRSGFASGTYGPFVWGSGMNSGFNAKAWEPLLRMWGISPDSPRWQEMMRDLERGQAPWGTVNQVMEDVAAAVSLPVDVEESEDAYAFIADVPGLEKGDIKIRVNQEERQLIISGERRRPTLAGASPGSPDNASTSEERPSGGMHRRKSERRFGKFERKLGKLPEDADLDAVTARVEKGVLTVWIRKAEGARPNIKDVFID